MNYTNASGTSRWITIGLVALLLISAAFAAWAIYVTQFNKESPLRIGDFNGITTPPVPEYNCPLDGTIVATRAETAKRPVMVQIDNAPAARPQSGMSQADIVYEAMAEGDITRFSAIFACREASTVGPVRSARLVNLELVPQYKALLANSGSSIGVSAELEAAALPNINHPSYPQAYWRVDDRFAPHNLMTGTEGIRDAAESVGIPTEVGISSLDFKDDSPVPSISTVGVPYSAIADVVYQYDPGTNRWLRFLQGEPHIDILTGEQLAPKNVIIQYVNSTRSNIEEDPANFGLIFDLQGSGRAQIFRDGQMIEGTWVRPEETEITRYVDAAGQPIPLNRGLTFIQLVGTDFQPDIG